MDILCNASQSYCYGFSTGFDRGKQHNWTLEASTLCRRPRTSTMASSPGPYSDTITVCFLSFLYLYSSIVPLLCLLCLPDDTCHFSTFPLLSGATFDSERESEADVHYLSHGNATYSTFRIFLSRSVPNRAPRQNPWYRSATSACFAWTSVPA